MAESLDFPITAVGAATPVGLSAGASCAALRAGIARLGPVPTFLVNGELVGGEPAVGGRVPLEWLTGGPEEIEWTGHRLFGRDDPPPPEAWIPSGPSRLADLARPAAREAWAAAGFGSVGDQGEWIRNPLRSSERIGVYLGLDPRDEAAPALDAVIDVIGAPPAVRHAEREGRAAALVALRQAAKDLLAGKIDVALVGGVDSLLRAEAMSALRDAGTLKSASRPTGVLPGEAAAFFVVERSVPSNRRPLAVLQSVVDEEEPTVGTEDPNIARGLTRALRRARLSAPPLAARPLAVCDLNGDRSRALEWGMASMRAFADLHSPTLMWHPADCIGDAGAGLGALNIVWGATALAKGYAGTDRVLVWGASDGPARAAALLASAPKA